MAVPLRMLAEKECQPVLVGLTFFFVGYLLIRTEGYKIKYQLKRDPKTNRIQIWPLVGYK